MKPLRCIDLFSGIGGLTLALEGVTNTVMYCEADASAVSVLKRRMRCGDLPHAPISTDVRTLDREWLAHQKLDMRNTCPQAVLAGFPCVGFSSAGKHGGYEDKGTSLFFEILRVVDILRTPPILFLENVSRIVREGMDVIFTELCVKRRYEVYWTTFSAERVGAPQKRERWYCIAIPRDLPTSYLFRLKKLEPTMKILDDWKKNRPPSRVFGSSLTGHARQRIQLLGNSVVPSAARVAYMHLLDCMRSVGPRAAVRVARTSRQSYPPSGAFFGENETNTILITLPSPPTHKNGVVDFDIRLVGHDGNVIKKTHWATLTRTDGLTGTHNHLTLRSSGCIKAQIQFETRTEHTPEHRAMSPLFAEWLMGFPSHWTDEKSCRVSRR